MRSRGESGTGTLIIFIAAIFTATVAASVFIQTGDATQQRALNAGGQAMQQVSTGAQIISVYGADGKGNLENLTIVLRVNAGSEAISLSGAAFQVDTANTSTTYLYTQGAFSVNATTENGTYAAVYVQRGPENKDGTLSRGDLTEISLEAPRALRDGERVRVSFLPPTGLPTTTTFFIPDITTTQRVALYP